MNNITASYDFDIDPRYGHVHIMDETGGDTALSIIIQKGGKSYMYKFKDGKFTPTCCCSAWNSSECCCETGNWDCND